MSRRPEYRRSIKRGRIVEWPTDVPSPEQVASRVTYTGNPVHKAYPSKAGPAAQRADKAKCDQYRERDWPKLLCALRKAIKAGCVGQFRGSFPSRAWVWVNGILHEARLTGNGDYHGFPLDDRRQYPEPAERLEEAPSVEITVN